ncbi:hypothetical protein GCM10027034_37960 [Ramlibacter solisilvae]|uniref:hypothetical protein n=1 Tax=Ramlibacter tataouinensis TaxID=94132 RepID=UPI0039EE067D
MVSPEEILSVPADVLAPYALSAILNSATVPSIQAPIVAGAAKQPAREAGGWRRTLRAGGLDLPDLLVNAGGFISVATEYLGIGQEAQVMAEVARNADRVGELLERCRDGVTRATEAWARSKLSA